MKNHVSREHLLKSFKSLQNQFDSSLAQAKNHERSFDALRHDFMRKLAAHAMAARANLPDNNPLKQQVLGFINVMEKTKAEWNTKIAGREKGVRFREGFEDSLLVFVSGKVKSGKSSLGNYIAWGHTDPDDERKQKAEADGLVPCYFSHENTGVKGGDKKHEAKRRREFRVGATEATSSIQGFNLPGLTWIDSPGLHSLKVENEKLARDYVEHADLILYTMKSDSPGRESDIDEIAQLFSKEKKALLLLTGSDDTEEDYDEEADCLIQTVVMKDTQRREKQRAYVREALENNCSAIPAKNVEIISFSARYAQLNSHNPDAFSESGMGQLCETLHRITQSDGVRIKQRTPLANMHTFLKSCRDDLRPYSELILSFKQPLEDLKRQLYRKLNTHIRSGQAELIAHIDEFFDALFDQRNDESEVTKQLTTFQQSLNKKYKKINSDKLEQLFEDIMVGFQNAVKRAYIDSDLVKLPEFKIEKIEEQIPVVRSSTKDISSLLGAALGGGAGFLLGGPAGAAIGATLGGGLGNMAGDSADIDYRSIDITVGDNLHEIHQQAIRTSEKIFEEQMRKSADSLWLSIDQAVEELLRNLSREITSFESNINQMLRMTGNA